MFARPGKRKKKLQKNLRKKFPLNEMKEEKHEDFGKT
jgi:hypothetical protein